MQSRRAWLPTVHPVVTLGDIASLPGVARADLGGEPLSAVTTTIVVGPEGGWTEAERSIELPAVSLSDAVLRAETASIAAATLLAAQRRLAT